MMHITPLFKKLNLKMASLSQDSGVVVLNAPASFDTEIATLGSGALETQPGKHHALQFLLAFVTQQHELQTIASQIIQPTDGDVIIWFAYPKRTSKLVVSELSRDSAWQALGNIGFVAVRQIAIDDDWSALRFRRVEFIKVMQRDPQRALTQQAKIKTLKN